MPFLNPLDILGFPPSGPTPDAEAIRKGRRRKLLEFELGNGSIVHAGCEITRTDFSQACEDLDDPRKLAAYRALQRLPELQDFLSTGDTAFFKQPVPEWIYAASFVGVVGSAFAERFGSTLAQAIRKRDPETVGLLVSKPPLASDALHGRLYAEAERALADIIDSVKGVTRAVKDGGKPDTVKEVNRLVDIVVWNALSSHFEGTRSRLAVAVRDLSVSAFNDLDDAPSSYALIRAACSLRANPTTSSKLSADEKQIGELHRKRRLTGAHAGPLRAAAQAIAQIEALTKQAERDNVDTGPIRQKAISLVDVSALNAIPKEIAGPRDHVALSLRGLALTCWNKQDNADDACTLTRLALTIKTDDEIKDVLQEDLTTLVRLGKEFETHVTQEGRTLLTIVNKIKADTAGGFLSSPNINWSALGELLGELLGKGGALTIRRIKDPALKGSIAQGLQEIIDRLRRHRPSEAVRVQKLLDAVVPPGAAPRPAPPAAPARPTTPPPRSTPPPRPPAPSQAASRPQSDSGSGVGLILGVVGLIIGLIVIIAVYAAPPPEVYPPPVDLGETLDVVLTAQNGPLSRIYVSVDDGPRTPYWVELGESISLTAYDHLVIENELDDAGITVDGYSFPTDGREADGSLRITRAGVEAVASGSGTAPVSAVQIEPASVPEGSPYLGNQLTDGESPYDEYFGSGLYDSASNNQITFSNGQGGDAVVCLVDINTERVIRNEYVRHGSDYTMTEVPNGTYFVRYLYGSDWNSTLFFAGGEATGGFETSVSFKELRDDLLEFYDDAYYNDGYSGTEYNVTLYTTPDGNMESTTIDAGFFF